MMDAKQVYEYCRSLPADELVAHINFLLPTLSKITNQNHNQSSSRIATQSASKSQEENRNEYKVGSKRPRNDFSSAETSHLFKERAGKRDNRYRFNNATVGLNVHLCLRNLYTTPQMRTFTPRTKELLTNSSLAATVIEKSEQSARTSD